MKRPNLFLRCLLASVASGLAAAVAAWIFATLMTFAGFSFVALAFLPLLFVCVVFNLLGLLPLYLVARFTNQPVTAYYTTTIAAAVALSILIVVAPPYQGPFAVVAIPAHFIVALVSAAVSAQIALIDPAADKASSAAA
jgi:hypothetical protein